MKVEEHCFLGDKAPTTTDRFLNRFLKLYDGKNMVMSEDGLDIYSHNAFMRIFIHSDIRSCRCELRAVNNERLLGEGSWVKGRFSGFRTSEGIKLKIC